MRRRIIVYLLIDISELVTLITMMLILMALQSSFRKVYTSGDAINNIKLSYDNMYQIHKHYKHQAQT